MLNKKEIYKNIFVYKNHFKDIHNTLDVIKRSESQSKDFHISAWKSWGTFGTMAQSHFGILNHNSIKLDDKNIYSEQREVIQEIERVYLQVARDYIDSCKDSVVWPDFVTDFSLTGKNWKISSVDILKHRVDPDKIIAMHYHTDQSFWRMEDDSKKHILTVTVYLNDNHEGGEISFAHKGEEGISVTTFKPEAGDVVVFPSFSPYFHGVLPILKDEKYLLRMFYFWDYPGSPEWLDNQRIHGKEVWDEMEKKRLQDQYEFSKSQPFYNAVGHVENLDPNTLYVPRDLPEQNFTYINGKDL